MIRNFRVHKARFCLLRLLKNLSLHLFDEDIKIYFAEEPSLKIESPLYANHRLDRPPCRLLRAWGGILSDQFRDVHVLRLTQGLLFRRGVVKARLFAGDEARQPGPVLGECGPLGVAEW